MDLEAFHPGTFLQEEIEHRKLIKAHIAKELGIMPHHLSDLFKGRRNISASLAVKLEKALGISAEYWMNLQTSWDLQQARKELNT